VKKYYFIALLSAFYVFIVLSYCLTHLSWLLLLLSWLSPLFMSLIIWIVLLLCLPYSCPLLFG